MNCPKCGSSAYVGMTVVECSNGKCEHFKEVLTETARTPDPPYVQKLPSPPRRPSFNDCSYVPPAVDREWS